MTTYPAAASIAIATMPLEPWPIDPASILAGQPAAAGSVVSRSKDGCVLRGLWDCTPGRFRWEWTYDETLVVLYGRARVQVDGGPLVEIGPGDFAWFERGQKATWETIEHLRKAFHALSPTPLPF